MLRKAASAVSIVAASFTWVACVTDYPGRAGERTSAEAKLWGFEGAIMTTPASPYDGTWAPTVKYDRSRPGPVGIFVYQNPVFAAFSRDGIVDRDGDDIQGRAGSLTAFPATPAGKFNNGIYSEDNTPGLPCEFFANVKKDWTGGPGPAIAVCFSNFVEEVDKDLALQQDAFGSLDELFGAIWAGTLARSFTLELTSLTLNGATVPLETAFGISVTHNGVRTISQALDLSSPGGQALLRAILANTTSGAAYHVGLGFNGGLQINTPVFMQVAFNHDALSRFVH
jgi:hypothetical protein